MSEDRFFPRKRPGINPLGDKSKPSIDSLAEQLQEVKCNHLMGREVIEKQILDLSIGKLTAGYCQNWDRCPDNGWGNCTPDVESWVGNFQLDNLRNVFNEAELQVVRELRTKR